MHFEPMPDDFSDFSLSAYQHAPCLSQGLSLVAFFPTIPNALSRMARSSRYYMWSRKLPVGAAGQTLFLRPAQKNSDKLVRVRREVRSGRGYEEMARYAKETKQA